MIFARKAYAEEDVDKELKEIQQHGKDMEQAVQKAMGVLEPLGGAQKLQQKALTLASDKNFLDAAAKLWQHPNRNILMGCELGFFVFMLFFKAWRQSKNSHWFRRFISGAFYNLLSLAGLSFVLPALILGEPFLTVLRTVWTTISS